MSYLEYYRASNSSRMNEETQHVMWDRIKYNRTVVMSMRFLLKENYGILQNEDRMVSVCLSLSIQSINSPWGECCTPPLFVQASYGAVSK